MGSVATVPQGNGGGGRNQAMRNLMAVIGRDQGPEYEQTLAYNPTVQISTPTSLRTDRKVKTILLRVTGRLTVGNVPVVFRAGPPILGTPLFSLIQQATLRGQHLTYGAQNPIILRGETMAEIEALYKPGYVPYYAVSVNGGAFVPYASLSGNANATNDFVMDLPMTTFPWGVSMSDAVFYCINGPDWPGNLYLDILCADQTALGVTTAAVTLTALNSNAGVPSIDILTERPLLGKTFMSQISPGITFKVSNFGQPTAAVSAGAGGAGVKIADLTVGKDTVRMFAKVGTQLAATSAGVIAYSALLDNVLTNTFFSMDNRNLRFQGANRDDTLHKDYLGRALSRMIPAGYRLIDFAMTPGATYGNANAKQIFPSSTLTAARLFQMFADIANVAGTNIAEVVQEMILGAPKILKAAQ